ncbi:disease resistance protein At4g27190-like [Eucalyptus grandis]|uniref:disease resistance protein At4g27190-like n=1 Tax=Eucalyptus grandis TaxID=71139 RepID=UPI00192F0F17|nr:disease resistance protein At4g27190-like [Eucalyptus grandis]
MADIVQSIASKVAEYLAAPIGRRCGYLIFSNSYVGQLKEELEKLDDARVGLQRSVVDAENNMREIKREVNRWKNDAETVANKARGMLDNEGRAKKTCFCGWLPNPKERYCLGRDARKTAQAIQALIPQGKFESVYYESAPPGRVTGTPDVNSSAGDGGDTIADSRASVFQGIMKALDDEKLRVIGVYGPGGVGKTTLLEEVEKKLRKEKGPFHMIVKAKVSQIPVSKNIQDEIADALKLDLKDVQSERGRANRLLERLQRDPTVGIPSRDISGKCKLLLASRFEDVLKQKMCADETFFLGGLNNDEAFGLFAKTVGNRLEDDEDLKAIAARVVKKLAGLPLLIISVAKTLKESPVSAWRIAQIEIDESTKEIQETIVKLSYGHLKCEDAKCLFLLCGLIGGTIQVELLWDGGDDKKHVTIHDLYSEVVISGAYSGQDSLMINNNYGSWPKEKLEKCWACLVNVGSDRLAELMLRQFPHVKILMLSEQNDMGDCSRIDFTYMEELRVLYLRSMRITSLPSSMEILGNLRSLSINCYVGDVANLGKLKALRILSFNGSIISRLPKEIGKLTNLRSLNLNHCYLLKIIEPGALKGLINLEELHMKNSFDGWMGKHEIPSESCVAGLAELKSLTKLASLEISIPDPIILLEDGDLPFENLHKFWIKIGYFRFWIDREYEGLTAMSLDMDGVEGCDSILSRKWVKKNLQKTQCLYLSRLSEFKESPHELCTQGFREVKYLSITKSPLIKYIADSSNADPSNGLPLIAFGKLESFYLQNLVNLEKICHGPIAPECFNKLKVMRVNWCKRLKYLWRLSDMQRLVQLEEISLWECESMQSIVTHDPGEDIVYTNNKVELPNVRHLGLINLPNMTSFCTKAEITSKDIPIQVSLPCLESLVMFGLLGLEKILYSEPSLKYSNLKSLKIKESTSTSIILKDWILKLPNLESMKIACTPSVEVVFNLEELKVIKEVEILSRLSTLELSKLPNLRHMWKQDVKLQGISILQNLKKLFINNTGLSFLFPLSVAKCLREIRDIKVVDCPNMKAVIVDEEGRDDGIDDIIEFPLLERLSISHCPTEKFFSYPHGQKESITTTSDSQDTYSDSFFDQKV